ncbi:MAG: hypothetical protein WC578_06130 [Candidatus Omnitrophota bacterium]|jgi:hypothetical protein
MEQEEKLSILGKISKVFARFFTAIDKKMEEEAKSKPCCCKPGEGNDKSCCN